MQVTSWFKKNFNDFNTRLIYEDNERVNFKSLEQLEDDQQVIFVDET